MSDPASPRRILIVDDEPAAADALREILEDDGYQVDTAETGKQALERLAATSPDLLLTDLCLPDVDGLDLGRTIQSRTGCEVVVMSGSERARQGAAHGFDHLMKPIRLAELRPLVAAALARRTGAPPS